MNTSKEYAFYRIGQYSFDPGNRTIHTPEGNEYRLQKKTSKVLVYLVNNPGKVVTRHELIDTIWVGNYFVGEKALSNAVWKLRKTLLNKQEQQQELIQTIPKKGYLILDKFVNKPQLVVPYRKNNNKKLFANKKIIFFALFMILLPTIFTLPKYFDLTRNHTFTLRSITTQDGQERYPALSPDGKFLAYVVTNSKHEGGLYIRYLDTNKIIQLVPESGILSPKWSPDGKHIAYAKIKKNQLCDLYIISTKSLMVERLTDCADNFTGSHSWYKFGEEIAYSSRREVNGFPGGILSINLESKKIRQLTQSKSDEFTDFDLNWSSKNNQLAYTKMTSISSNEIFLLNKHGVSKQLTNNGARIRGHSWTPDGKSLVFASDKSEGWQLWKIDVKTGAQEKLGIFGRVVYPDLSKDGKQLFFEKSRIEINISSIKLSSKNTKPNLEVIIDSIGRDSDIDYSNKKNRLVFGSNRTGVLQIWTSRIDGTDSKQITLSKKPSLFPIWSYNGSKIAYIKIGRDNKYDQVFIYDLEDNSHTQFTKMMQPHLNPSWSRDGKYLYVTQPAGNEWTVWRHPVNGETPIQLTKGKGLFSKEFFDGKSLFFTKPQHSAIWKLDLESKVESLVVDTENNNIQGNWAFNEQGIYFLGQDKNNDYIRFFHFKDQTTQLIATLPHKSVFNSTFSIVDNKLLYTHRSKRQSDIKLATFDQSL